MKKFTLELDFNKRSAILVDDHGDSLRADDFVDDEFWENPPLNVGGVFGERWELRRVRRCSADDELAQLRLESVQLRAKLTDLYNDLSALRAKIVLEPSE